MSERIHIFSCGTQYSDWVASNCERCKKYNPDGIGNCDIDNALLIAYFDDGKVCTEIAKRAGLTEQAQGSYVWVCGEVDWTEEWKAQYLGESS